jgi:hypothetical protein
VTTTYTPGPWAMSRDAVPDWHTQITIYAEATGERVATAFETPANACLIAAAPAMRERLAEFVLAFDHSNTYGDFDGGILHEQADAARALLAQIDGGTDGR